MPPLITPRPAAAVLVGVLAACGCTGRALVPPDSPAARATPPKARPPVPLPAPSRATVPGKPFPECDPRASDADRERAALGLLASDCLDERGRNRAYVTRLVAVRGGPSPAGGAGVLPGDRIVRLDACEVATTHQLARQLERAVPGWVPRLVVERTGRELAFDVPTTRLAPSPQATAAPHLSTAGCRAIGRKPAMPGP